MFTLSIEPPSAEARPLRSSWLRQESGHAVLSSTTEQALLVPPRITRICKRFYIRPYAGEFPRYIAFLLPTVKVAEASEHEQRMTQRFNEGPASSESLVPEPPYHLHVCVIHLIS